METLIINGGRSLNGEFTVSGSKNAILPILAAAMLTDDEVIIHNVPKISDIDDMLCIMRDLGISSKRDINTLCINASGLNNCRISDEHVGKIRSSVVLMGAVIARLGMARLARPGGCDIGKRPIDMHLDALSEMGVVIKYEDQCWCCNAQRLKGAEIALPFPSVGATENVILAAAMANGTTVIKNAAREPEIKALEDFINLMGGNIRGSGTGTITVEGKKSYHGCEYKLVSDRIVAGTYMLMAASAGSDVLIKDTDPNENGALINTLLQMGADIKYNRSGIRIKKPKRLKAIEHIETQPFPGFATDLQPQLMAVLSLADGTSLIRENIYENRFRAAYSLAMLGADISIRVTDSKNNSATIRGVERLRGTDIYGTDLRCNAALVTAALCAEGKTTLHHAHYIERGYEDIVSAIKGVGGDIVSV